MGLVSSQAISRGGRGRRAGVDFVVCLGWGEFFSCFFFPRFFFFLRTHTACCKYEAPLPHLPLYQYAWSTVGHVSWVRSVLQRSCTAPHNGRFGYVDDLDRDLSHLSVRRAETTNSQVPGNVLSAVALLLCCCCNLKAHPGLGCLRPSDL